jgi:hypothetical protein
MGSSLFSAVGVAQGDAPPKTEWTEPSADEFQVAWSARPPVREPVRDGEEEEVGVYRMAITCDSNDTRAPAISG